MCMACNHSNVKDTAREYNPRESLQIIMILAHAVKRHETDNDGQFLTEFVLARTIKKICFMLKGHSPPRKFPKQATRHTLWSMIYRAEVGRPTSPQLSTLV